MNLLLAIKSLNVVGGGAERVLVSVANGMARRGHEVGVMTFDQPGGASFYALDAGVRRIDVGICEPGQPTPRGRFLQAMLRIRRLVKAAGADLVVPFMHSTYVPLAAALAGSGTRMVVSEHVNATHFERRALQRALTAVATRMAVAKTVPTAAIRQEHAAHLRGKVHVLPNPVDLERFEAVQDEPPAHPPVILAVGRFMEEKSQVDLIRAFASLAAEFPQWQLRLVGEGPLRPLLEGEAERLGLGDRVRMPGVSRDVPAEYAAASIVAIPSRYESFGLVAAEALASRRAVIGFEDCVGIADIVRHEHNGLLAPASEDRVAQLAAGLRRLMNDEGLRVRLAAAGPDSVRRFGAQQVLDLWESFFESLERK